MIKLNILRWDYPRLYKWDLNAITCILKREGRGKIWQKRRQCVSGGKEWIDTAMAKSQGNSNHKKLKRQWTDSSLEPLEGALPSWYLDFSPVIPISDFWPLELCERTNVCCFKKPSLCNLLEQLQETDTASYYPSKTMKIQVQYTQMNPSETELLGKPNPNWKAAREHGLNARWVMWMM